jgi:hypothetical protein
MIANDGRRRVALVALAAMIANDRRIGFRVRATPVITNRRAVIVVVTRERSTSRKNSNDGEKAGEAHGFPMCSRRTSRQSV